MSVARSARFVRPWRIDVERRPGVPRLVPNTVLRAEISTALAAAGAPVPSSLGLVLSDDAELARLNLAHLGHLGPTDVLSFPLLPPEAFPDHPGKAGAIMPATAPATVRSTSSGTAAGSAFVAAPAVVPAFALPPGRRPHLGDIVVSVERAIVQAQEGRGGQTGHVTWAAADELRLLVIHGTLHICGWDHADPIEEAAMRRLERQLHARIP